MKNESKVLLLLIEKDVYTGLLCGVKNVPEISLTVKTVIKVMNNIRLFSFVCTVTIGKKTAETTETKALFSKSVCRGTF